MLIVCALDDGAECYSPDPSEVVSAAICDNGAEAPPVSYAAAALPIAALTRGMTSSAINCIERLASAGSTQSMPA